jgi:hypothetical protein
MRQGGPGFRVSGLGFRYVEAIQKVDKLVAPGLTFCQCHFLEMSILLVLTTI